MKSFINNEMYNEYFFKYSRYSASGSWVGSGAKGKQLAGFETWGRPLYKVLSGEGWTLVISSRESKCLLDKHIPFRKNKTEFSWLASD